MDDELNEQQTDEETTAFSDFPAALAIDPEDAVVGLKSGANTRFLFSAILAWLQQMFNSLFIPNSQKGANGGVATLNASGQVPDFQLDLSGKQDKITASGILKGDGAGGVSAATPGQDYQAPLTIDAAPTASSTNPVQSGGVYTDVRTRVPNYGKGQNILRNWYFLNPVNQRGNTSGTTTNNAYFLDGWKTTYGTTSGTWALTTTGLQVTSATGTYAVIMQNVDDALLNGFALTASLLLSDGTIDTETLASRTSGTSQYFGSGVSWQIDGNGVFRHRVYGTQTIVAIKLELGTEQTLAHQENGVWVLNEIPNYEYELYRCITSTADPADIYANKVISTNVSKPNLLDNWYFLNPVNQRGQSSYTGAVRGIDRWTCRMSTGSVSVTTNGVTLSKGSGNAIDFYQPQEEAFNKQLVGKTVTVSVLLYPNRFVTGTGKWQVSASGTLITESDFYVALGQTATTWSNFYIRATSDITIQAIKLELGSEQTLCHNEGTEENPVWVLNEIADYEEELIKCQTNTSVSGDDYANKSLATRQDLTNIQATGTTNTTGAAIPAGAYFYLNGVLHRAKVQIDQNATFTVNTNCEQGYAAVPSCHLESVTFNCDSSGRHTFSKGELPNRALSSPVSCLAKDASNNYLNTGAFDINPRYTTAGTFISSSCANKEVTLFFAVYN